MAYDEDLASRVRKVLAHNEDLTERKMFGGISFMLRGNMCCGVIGEDLVVRVGPDRFEAALAETNVRPMDFTGRPLKGFVYVGPIGCRSDAALEHWVQLGVAFTSMLRAK